MEATARDATAPSTAIPRSARCAIARGPFAGGAARTADDTAEGGTEKRRTTLRAEENRPLEYCRRSRQAGEVTRAPQEGGRYERTERWSWTESRSAEVCSCERRG